jgi:hypothetical protein
MEDYQEKFGQTIKILPAFENHVPPDLQHLVLQTLTLIIIIVTTLAAVSLLKIRKK